MRSRLQTVLEDQAAKYKRLSEATKGNPNMVLTIDTVKTDVKAFGNIIPYVEELLDFYSKNEQQLALDDSTHTKLSDVLYAIGNATLPESTKIRRELELLEVKRKNYQELTASTIKFEIFRVSTNYSVLFPDLAGAADEKQQYTSLLLNRLVVEAKTEFRDSKKGTAVEAILEKAKNKILSDPKVPEDKKQDLYNMFRALFLDYGTIGYRLYLCQVCVTLLQNNPQSGKFRLWRFDSKNNRWDTTISHSYP